jgi:hypothetical protein
MRTLISILIVTLAACTAAPDPTAEDAPSCADAGAEPDSAPPAATPQRIGNYCLVVGCEADAECRFLIDGAADGCCLADGTCARAVDIGGGECFPPGPIPAGELCPNDDDGDGMCASGDRWYRACPWMV